LVVLQKKFKKYGDLFLKYGWVVIILAATTPLPFAMVSFIAGYFKFSPATFLKIVVPVRIVRFFISAWFIKNSITLL
jgi:membrane protein YqaA with SNARE-associated domain